MPGAGGGSRTRDLPLTRRLLWPLSYTGTAAERSTGPGAADGTVAAPPLPASLPPLPAPSATAPGPTWPQPVVTRTAGGLRAVALERPGPVVALRLSVQGGARDDEVAGATHMLEHLLFQTEEGAAARRSVERRGGEIGANTTREQLSIDLVVLPGDVPAALDALGQLVRARPRAGDLEREKTVVIREAAHEAEERRRIWQLQAEALYGRDHPLARPILGSESSIRALSPDALLAAQGRLTASRAVLAAVGPLDAPHLADALDGIVPIGGARVEVEAPTPIRPERRRHEERQANLLHLAVGWRFDGLGDARLPALRLAEIILAHGSGSRLYEQLRTRRRLAYRVSTVLIPYRDAGHLSAVTACDPNHADRAERALIGEFERLAARGPSWSELEEAKRQHAGAQARAFESSRRLAAYSATQLVWDRLRPLDEERAAIEALQPADVRAACAALLRNGPAVASVGRSPEPTDSLTAPPARARSR